MKRAITIGRNTQLAACGSMLDAAEEPRTRAELERLMALDVAELAAAYRKMEAAVGRGGEA